MEKARSMKTVSMYTTPNCPFCAMAKEILRDAHIPFEETDLSHDPELRSMLSRQTGWKTVPMIFIGEEFVGGCQELIQLKQSGQLLSKIHEDRGE